MVGFLLHRDDTSPGIPTISKNGMKMGSEGTLTDAMRQLLFALASLAGEPHLSLAEKLTEIALSSAETDVLCELVSNEFLMEGMQEDFEANGYGRDLELLLDALNHGRLHRALKSESTD